MTDPLRHVDPLTPILVGCGQITDMTSAPSDARSPVAFVAEAASLALADARPGEGTASLAAVIDSIAILRFFSESSPRFTLPYGRSAHPPRSVANRIGARNARSLYYTEVGGNLPQYLTNKFAEQIARGEIRAALVGGGELLRSSHMAQRQKLDLNWAEDPGGDEPLQLGDTRLGWSEEEARHGLMAAIYFYPLIENAIRGDRQRSTAQHLKDMGTLFARFAAVAKANPLATRRDGYSADTLAHVDESNRFISFPYPRLMNSNAFVDQTAAFVMTSVEQARKLGIPQDRWVFLHGCADGADTWVVSERTTLHRSPAIRGCASRTLDMAGKTLNDISFFDLYSCFPSAVQIGCREIGLSEDDPRGLTVTGGLPYFGGPGNNYVSHSIAEMMNRLRARPGTFGLVTGNGSYVTKHSAGLYSTTPVAGAWKREDPDAFQAELDSLPSVQVATSPVGDAKIETYTVAFDKEKPVNGFVFGRLADTGQRFVANTPSDPEVLQDLIAREQLGRPGVVRPENDRNIFMPA